MFSWLTILLVVMIILEIGSKALPAYNLYGFSLVETETHTDRKNPGTATNSTQIDLFEE